jgi:hypothetical protein
VTGQNLSRTGHNLKHDRTFERQTRKGIAFERQTIYWIFERQTRQDIGKTDKIGHSKDRQDRAFERQTD